MLLLNTSFKLHLKIAAFVAVWLVFFLILIAPFDVSDLSFVIRLQILPPYGIIVFLAYVLIVPVQNAMFSKAEQWSIFKEILVLLLFNVLALLGSFLYYQTPIINGTYSFLQFTFQVYYPIFFLLLPIIIFGRWFLTKKAMTPKKDELVLRGENRYDFLKIKLSDLIAISSADNYVEVSYLVHTELKKKLLRNTLKNIQEANSILVQVHRSHLINPVHFKEWKNTNTLVLTQMELPVSKKYKAAVMALENSPL